MHFFVVMYSAEVLKAAMQKSSSSVAASASPVLPTRGTAQPSSTLLVKKSGATNTLTPLGPLGFSLRDDDDGGRSAASSATVRPRRQQPAADAGYSADELQVLRSLFSVAICAEEDFAFASARLFVGTAHSDIAALVEHVSVS